MGLGADWAGTGSKGGSGDAPGAGCIAGDRGRAATAAVSGAIGGGIWGKRPERRGAERTGRGASGSGENRGTLLRSGALSTQGRAAAQAVWCGRAAGGDLLFPGPC